jgi:L-2,4-diaminobutyrate decarboxylase
MAFEHDAQTVVGHLAAYEAASVAKDHPVVRLDPLADLVERLDLHRFARKGGLTGAALDEFLGRYLAATTRLHHPAHLAHQVSVPHYAGALAALVDGFTNNPMAIYEMGPAAAAIECFVVNWMLEKVGWTPAPLPPTTAPAGSHGAGVLTHGGSLANLTALTAARSRAVPDVWNEGNPGGLALLAPAQSHYSVARAAGILGIGAQGVYALAVDDRGVVIPDRLVQVWQRALDDGRKPIALVANACSTAVGLYDPLQEMGAFCREQGVWFHVDGAHGASALLSRRHRHRLSGVALADSLIWDAHKMLRAPPLCAAVLVRDHRDLDGAFHEEASYLFHEKEQPGVDLIHRTVECTKAGLGLKVFFVLGALGEGGLTEYVERQVALTREAYDLIQAQPDFHCPVVPESNILCFSYRDWSAEHLRLRDQLIARGAFHLSTVALQDRWHLRMVLMNPHTTLGEVWELLDTIRAIAGLPEMS